jgi:carbamoyl-phosphate synthase large subunit
VTAPRTRFTILLSCAGRRVSLMRSLREAVAAIGYRPRILACDTTWNAAAMHLADAAFTVPACTDPGFPEVVLGRCAADGIDLVVPTIDPELPVWARLREELGRSGTTVAVSDQATVAIAADKRLTNAHCLAAGVPCPRQAPIRAAVDDPGAWPVPLVAKPPLGSASQGVRHIDRRADLADLADQDLIVEERASGVEHTVDVYVDRGGTVRGAVVRRRLEVRAGEVSKALVVRDERLVRLAVRAIGALPGAYGPLNLQVFADGERATVIEINARFAGGYPLSWRAGGRHGEWLVREVLREQIAATGTAVEFGTMMLRWDEEVFVRAGG